jgi:hypothetical protein
MKSRLVTFFFAIAAALSAGFVVFGSREARGVLENTVTEQRLGPNALRVMVHGRWHEVALMPLDDTLCASGDEYFERYCR